MKYTIAKQFTFSASHQLSGLVMGHPCSRLHGHNYTVEIILQSDKLSEVGFVVDYGDLKPFKEYIDGKLDHRHLNNVFGFNPTAENIARHLFEIGKSFWSQVSAVRISETDKTWAEYAE
jgi:6-pyruvoyltetrahydropterin/6-carboxytetrahydropterin synthase